MRNNLLKVGLFTVALVLFAPAHTHALALDKFSITDDPIAFSNKKNKAESQTNVESEKTKASEGTSPAAPVPPAPAPPAVITHTVGSGENLSLMATNYSTTWVRLFNKNTQIVNPDVLQSGETITIPSPEEVLPERPLPMPEPVQAPTPPQKASVQTRRVATQSASRVSSAGNTYAPGYCTWYAKNRRPDLPNRMGNAISWVSSAASQGFATGSAPRVGAIGQQGNHVVYVESVNGDGTVTVSEMNYQGLYVISSRTVPVGNFMYIY